MRYRGLLTACAIALFAPTALAQAKVTNRISAPYIPFGYVLELTEDCKIESSGKRPDAHLRCAPNLGWRIVDTAGRVIYPADGYLRPDLKWAFGGSNSVALKSGQEITIVQLPSGTAEVFGEGSLEQLRNVEGIPFAAVVWPAETKDGEAIAARPLMPTGELGPAIANSDMRGLPEFEDLPCWRAGVLAGIKVEDLPNTRWQRIVRLRGEGRTRCDAVRFDTLAGLDDDGRWRSLDNETLRARGDQVFITVEEALAWQ